jgi:hypothetical protein
MKRTICAALLLGGCFADTQDSPGSDADGTTAADTAGDTTGDTPGTETSEGTETTGESTGTPTDTSGATSGATDGTASEGSTGTTENPYLPCASGTCEDGTFCSVYDGFHVCSPPCNPGTCPILPGWDVTCNTGLCRLVCGATTPCPEPMICTAFVADEGKCFYP